MDTISYDIRDFIFDKMSEGVIVFDQNLKTIFSNRQAELFVKRCELPGECSNDQVMIPRN